MPSNKQANPTNENDSAMPSRPGGKSGRTAAARRPLQAHNGDVQTHEATHQPQPSRADLDAANRRIAELEARLTERQASHPAPQSVPDDSIPRPRNASKIPMREIFRLLGYDKAKWNALRAYVRDALLAACLHWDLEWKAQRPEKQSRAYNAIEDAFPETRRFANQWAIDRIAKQFWDNHKTYRNCVGNDSTYRGRQAAARRADHPLPDPQSLSPIPLDSVRSRSRSRDPTPGPSRPRRLARSNVINSDDDDSGSDDDDCDDDPLVCHDDDDDDDDDDVEEEEEEEDVSGKGKAKAKAPGKRAAPSQSGPTSKRRRS